MVRGSTSAGQSPSWSCTIDQQLEGGVVQEVSMAVESISPQVGAEVTDVAAVTRSTAELVVRASTTRPS